MDKISLQPLSKLGTLFDALAGRERVLLWGAALVVLTMGWYALLMEPVVLRYREVTAQLQSAGLTADTQGESRALQDAGTLLEQINALRASLQQDEAQLKQSSRGLIPAAEMHQFLHNLLQQQPDVTLVSLGNQPATELPLPVSAAPESIQTESAQTDSDSAAEDATDEAAAADAMTDDAMTAPVGSGVFIHPVSITVEGSFTSIVAYLRALENSPWRFDWQRFELTAQRYPLSRARIDLNTLSLDPNLLGL